jgi:hypothetical protein
VDRHAAAQPTFKPSWAGYLELGDSVPIKCLAMADDFEVVGKITNIETLAVGRNIKELRTLQARFGRGRWRKLKGVATVSLADGTIRFAEVHWYEAHGIGKVRMKIKRYLD